MKIGIIGSGNLSWHLAGVIPDRAVVFYQVDPPEGNWPCPILSISEVSSYTWDALFLAVPDRSIKVVSEHLSPAISSEVPIFHTSGATPLNTISGHFRHRGVLWPIRSLRKGDAVGHWRDLPLVLQADGPKAKAVLTDLADSLSGTTYWLDDEQRAQLHLAAVFSNNFVTALYEVAYDLCSTRGIPFELLVPIIINTAQTQDGSRPANRQTGAAARGDQPTMDRHLSLLERQEYKDLYRLISNLILQYRLPENNAHLRRNSNDDL